MPLPMTHPWPSQTNSPLLPACIQARDQWLLIHLGHPVAAESPNRRLRVAAARLIPESLANPVNLFCHPSCWVLHFPATLLVTLLMEKYSGTGAGQHRPASPQRWAAERASPCESMQTCKLVIKDRQSSWLWHYQPNESRAVSLVVFIFYVCSMSQAAVFGTHMMVIMAVTTMTVRVIV